MKQARDLFLLSAIAFQQGKHSDSGKLFATAMASSDVEEFLDLLNEERTVTSGSLLSTSRAIETSLEDATRLFAASLSEEAEDETIVSLPGLSEEADDEEDEDFDDIDSNMPGQRIIPSSISSSATPKAAPGTTGSRIVISSSLRSPVKVKS
jgi:hypothetical protein